MSGFHRWCRRCGWQGTYASAAKGDYAKRRHSCEKWTAKLAGQQRHAERFAAVDRTPKPCLHKRADHQHGTRAAYVLDRCRCFPCSTANAQAETHRERQKAYGRYDKYVDAQPVRDHVRALMAQGMGWKRVAAAAGVSGSSMWKLMPPQETHRDKIAASRARRYAKARGWLPPLALDDELLDRPFEGALEVEVGDDIDEVAIQRRMGGDKSVWLSNVEKRELRRRWYAAGRTGADLERICGMASARERNHAMKAQRRGAGQPCRSGDEGWLRVRLQAIRAAFVWERRKPRSSCKRGHHGAVAFVAIAAGANVQDG